MVFSINTAFTCDGQCYIDQVATYDWKTKIINSLALEKEFHVQYILPTTNLFQRVLFRVFFDLKLLNNKKKQKQF